MTSATSCRTLDVALVGSYPPPHGGQAVHIKNLFEYVRMQGLEAKVFNTGSDKDVRADGVVNVTSSMSLLRRLLEFRFKLLHVHVSGPEDYGKLVPVWFAATVKRFPWLITIHSGNSASQLRGSNLFRRKISGALLGAAQQIICVNDAIREELSKVVETQAVFVIPPFSLDFSGSPLSAELNAFIANHAPLIPCVGLYEPAYGFDHAVRLMSSIREIHRDARLLLIGDMKNADWCRSLIENLHLQNHVKLCGNLPHQECLAAIKRSTLFLRPTRYDGDAISVREALALGVPVIASETDFRP